MQLIVNGTDSLEHLVAARHVIEELIANRTGLIPQPISTGTANTSINVQVAPAPVATGNVAEPTPAPKPAAKAKPKVVKTVTADEVRLVMVEKAKAGKDQAIRDLLQDSFGVPKLSMVPPERLVELKTAVEAL